MDTDYYRKLNKICLHHFIIRRHRTYGTSSTFKPVTAIAGLSEGVITDNDYIYCGGRFDKLQGAPLNCWLLSGHGALSIRDGIANSCNVFFSETAYRLGQNAEGTFNDNTAMQQLIKYANLLGLDKSPGWRFLKHRHRFPTNCQSRPLSDRVLTVILRLSLPGMQRFWRAVVMYIIFHC